MMKNDHPKAHPGHEWRLKLKEMESCMLESIIYVAISFTYCSITMHLLKYIIIRQSSEQNNLAILVQKSMLIVGGNYLMAFNIFSRHQAHY